MPEGLSKKEQEQEVANLTARKNAWSAGFEMEGTFPMTRSRLFPGALRPRAHVLALRNLKQLSQLAAPAGYG